MLRLTCVCLCLLALRNGKENFVRSWLLPHLGQYSGSSNNIMEDNQWQGRQHFLLDLLLQVHKPLLHEKLIAMGDQLNEDPEEYKEGTWRYINDFQERVHQNRVPGPFSIINQLDEEMPKNLLGVYRFLTMARDWFSFQRNACYARIHFHPLLFVNALQMAVVEREDTKDLQMPAMYEVLPQLYFEKEVILAAQDVAWHQLTPIRMVTPKRRWRDILLGYRSPRQSFSEEEPMTTDPLIIDNERKLSYLSLDLELNSHWNSLINRLVISIEEGKERLNDPIIIDGDRLVAFRGSFDEVNYRNHMDMESNYHNSKVYLHNLQQFVAALTMEDLATGQRSMDLIDPPLLTTGGVPYKGTSLNIQAVRHILDLSLEDLKIQIDMAVKHNNHSLDNLKIAGQIIATNYLHICRQLSLAVNGNARNQANMLGLPTANLRDPIYRSLLFRLNDILGSYETRDVYKVGGERQSPKIVDIKVSNLLTYEETINTDLINLIDQQLLQSQRNNLQFLRRHLMARQRRLNHHPFSISLAITAPAEKTVLVRLYLLLPYQSRPLFHLDSFKCSLKKGLNQIHRLYPSAVHEPTLSQLYEANYPSAEVTPSIRFPPHLLLPRGTTEGLKLQLVVQLTAWSGSEMEFDGVSDPVLAENLKDVIIFHQQA
ncbi:larval serum protein 1 gamma chain [Drosophila eugracilis]|uniref:larval serum protein 1 gamma chain n=1 Tax=Drosophila eugracilis TaxID=29029 RepID=UPI0007E80742|nr:larval serum protein 1 gamma chain [Drosophila eugracilis]